MATITKPSNPKDLIGSDKLPLHLWPQTATALGCLGLLDGMLKYGRTNWRVAGVRASIYVDALARHMGAWFEGEDTDPDSGLPHLSHALACLAILADAQASGTMTDDRMVRGKYREHVTALTPHVNRLKELRKDYGAKHYTIADSLAPNNKVYEPYWTELFEKLTKVPKQAPVPATAPYQCYVIQPHVEWDDAEGDPNFWGADATGWRDQ